MGKPPGPPPIPRKQINGVPFVAAGRAETSTGGWAPFVRAYDFNSSGVPVVTREFPVVDGGNPTDVAVDSRGNVYVIYEGIPAVMVYANDGTPLRMIAGPSTGLVPLPGFGPLVAMALSIDADDNLYVLLGGLQAIDVANHINVFPYGADGDAPFLVWSNSPMSWYPPTKRLAGGTIHAIVLYNGHAMGLALSPSGTVCTSQMATAGDPTTPIMIFRTSPGGGITGDLTTLATPRKMTYDDAGILYVADGSRILCFNPDAQDKNPDPSNHIFDAFNVPPVRKISGPSTGLTTCLAVAVDRLGNVYVGTDGAPSARGTISIFTRAAGNVAPHTVLAGDIISVAGLAIIPPNQPQRPVWALKELVEVTSILKSYVSVDGESTPGHPSGPPDPTVDLLLAIAAYQLAGTKSGSARHVGQAAAMKVIAAVAQREFARLEAQASVLETKTEQ